MHFTYIHNGLNTKTKGKWQSYVPRLHMMTKRVNFISNLSNLRWTMHWSCTCTGIYFHNYFRCCWRRLWWDDVFPAGLHYLITFPTRMSKISQKCKLFRERMSWSRYTWVLFQKGEFVDSVDPRGNTSLATEIIGNSLSAFFTNVSF